MFVLAVQTEIFDTGYCWIVHLSFLTSHNLLFFRFCKTSKKTTFSVFLSFFSRKIAQISIFKVEYLENGAADFNDFSLILQDFERPFRWNQLVLALQFSFNATMYHFKQVAKPVYTLLRNKRGRWFRPPPNRSFEIRWRNIDILYFILKGIVWRFRFSLNFSKIFWFRDFISKFSRNDSPMAPEWVSEKISNF